MLAEADERVVYSFETREGTVRVRGASLRALGTDDASLDRTVLYCCDARAEQGISSRFKGAFGLCCLI